MLTRVLPLGAPEQSDPVDYILEQPAAEILNELLPKCVENGILPRPAGIAAAEHAARMSAMEAATSNAADMIDRLTLYMNRVRQASNHQGDSSRWSAAPRPRNKDIMATTDATLIGKVVQVSGPAVDCEFPRATSPWSTPPFAITSEGFEGPAPSISSARWSSTSARAACAPSRSSHRGLVRGMKAESLGHQVMVPVGKETLRPLLQRHRRAVTTWAP